MSISSVNFNDLNKEKRFSLHKERQKNNFRNTQEGVVVNSFIKDCCLSSGFIIPDQSNLPAELKDSSKKPKGILNNSFLPLCATTLSVLGGTAIITKLIHHCAKLKLQPPKWDKLPDIPRNMNLNSESHFVTYVAMQNPTFKTAMGAMAVFGFTAAIFIMKNFVDGFKEIWVKKQDAIIQKDLQEKLINVETRSFAGKNQIIRNLLRQKAVEMDVLLGESTYLGKIDRSLFKGFSFKGKKSESEHKNKWLLPFIGIGTFGVSLVLGLLINKNIKRTLSLAKDYSDGLHETITKILVKEKPEIADKEALKQCFTTLNFSPEFVNEQMQKSKIFKDDEITQMVDLVREKTKKYVQAPEALGGKRGIQYYSYIDGVEGHLYNWIMTECKLARNLFYSLATVTGLGYLGQKSVEAIKEVQVKRENTNTEYKLQEQLVEVELKNFLAKKNSTIEPLMDIFRKKISETTNKKELRPMANEILYEIKNGAPFVYS